VIKQICERACHCFLSFLAPLQGAVIGFFIPGVKTPGFTIMPFQGINFIKSDHYRNKNSHAFNKSEE